MKFTVVKFNPEGDGVTALYIDGKLHIHGDYYHNKIDEWIDGFLAGSKHLNWPMQQEAHYVPSDNCKPIYEDGQEPPPKWPDKRKRYYKHKLTADQL